MCECEIMKESGKILNAPITRIFLNDTNMKRKISKGYLIGLGVMEDQLMCVQVVATITRHGFHRPLVTSGHNINIHAFIGIGLQGWEYLPMKCVTILQSMHTIPNISLQN